VVCGLEGSSDVDTFLEYVDCVVVRGSVKFSMVGSDIAANKHRIISRVICSSCYLFICIRQRGPLTKTRRHRTRTQ